MQLTRSGDYTLPGRLSQHARNLLLWLTRWVPKPLQDYYLKRHGYYQTFGSTGDRPPAGSSLAKWEVLPLPGDLSGKSVVDIGCAEGFFCQQAARRGASMVLGIDSELKPLICAKMLAGKHNNLIKFRVAAFPMVRLGHTFDYVFCLSVLHHCLSTKDAWKVLTEEGHGPDKAALGECLNALRSITNVGGTCIIELPYEYDDPTERDAVDFDRFTQCLRDSGFSSANVVGQWQHGGMEKKDRVIYVAHR